MCARACECMWVSLSVCVCVCVRVRVCIIFMKTTQWQNYITWQRLTNRVLESHVPVNETQTRQTRSTRLRAVNNSRWDTSSPRTSVCNVCVFLELSRTCETANDLCKHSRNHTVIHESSVKRSEHAHCVFIINQSLWFNCVYNQSMNLVLNAEYVNVYYYVDVHFCVQNTNTKRMKAVMFLCWSCMYRLYSNINTALFCATQTYTLDHRFCPSQDIVFIC